MAQNESSLTPLPEKNPAEFLVAVEKHNAFSVSLFYRNIVAGMAREQVVEYKPWALTQSPSRKHPCTPFEGIHPLRFCTRFPSFSEAGVHMNYCNGVYWHSVTRNFLSAPENNLRLFSGAAYHQPVRMIIDIETTGLDPEKDRVFLFGCVTNRGDEIFLEGDEKEIIDGVNSLFHEIDPDIVEGYNSYKFDIPFLLQRASIIGTRLEIGRDKSPPRIALKKSVRTPHRQISINPVYIYGRQCIDTWIAVMKNDRGDMESHRLKYVARYYHVAVEDRPDIPGQDVYPTYRKNPELVLEYLRHDLRETLAVGDLVLPPYWYLCQYIPDGLQNIILNGNADLINCMLVTEYVQNKRSVPLPSPVKDFPGGYVECRRTGIFEPVAKIDVESLYPTIMLQNHIQPANDTQGAFLKLLKQLTDERVAAKRNAKESPAAARKQAALKILINSFYGYLGTEHMHFNDCNASARVTEIGRDIVKRMSDYIDSTGNPVLEVDTDGIYFVCNQTDPETIRVQLESLLENKYRLSLECNGVRMLSLRAKNYALYDGKQLHVTGSALKNRGLEPFLRDFVDAVLHILLTGNDKEQERLQKIVDLYHVTVTQLVKQEIPMENIVRAVYKTRNDKSGTDRYISVKTSDGSIYLRQDEEDAPENTLEWKYDCYSYVVKLYKCLLRFLPVIPEMEKMVPEPDPEWYHHVLSENAGGQQKLC